MQQYKSIGADTEAQNILKIELHFLSWKGKIGGGEYLFLGSWEKMTLLQYDGNQKGDMISFLL